MTRLRTNLTRGVTLVEMMVVMGMVVVLAVTSASVATEASKTVASAARLETATRLGQSLLSVLLSVPYDAVGTGASAPPNSLFSNTTTANDGDITDAQGKFASASIATDLYDHSDSDLVGTPLAPLEMPAPSGTTTYYRYWNVSGLGAGNGNGVAIAVIVRWQANGTWYRTSVLGTRYPP